MSIWKIMNWVAWGLSGFFLLLILADFFKVEKKRFQNERTDND